MRRLPIYFLIDVSESMIGDPIDRVQEGIATIIQELKTDPNALETVYISIVVFAGEAKTIVPLQDIISFYPPKFPIGSGTSLSKGLGHLMFELRRNLVKTTADTKGDWKPIVFLFTDGVPTDNTTMAINEWNKNWKRTANIVAVSLGSGVDNKVLLQLTENVLQMENTDASSYKEFFKWVTDSIKTSSQSIETNKAGIDLAKINSDNLKEIDHSQTQESYVDDNFVVIAGKCQNTKKGYLMKYRKDIVDSGFGGLGLSTRQYRLTGAYQVDDSYEELSDGGKSTQHQINTQELVGAPTCPCCGNQIAFAVCQCNQIHCIGNEAMSTCPGCGNVGRYGAGTGGFDVNRTQG